jgi:hypothetical protein
MIFAQSGAQGPQPPENTDPILDVAVRTSQEWIRTPPRPVNWDVILQFDRRYADYRVPTDVACATVKCMLIVAQQQTHCPVVLSRVSGFSLRFTAAVAWCLLRCHRWLDEEDGYTDLIKLMTSDRDVCEEVDALVWPLYEALLFDPSSEIIDLRYEWAACMGIPPEL